MFGTLIVCLPPQFLNGKLVLSHRGVVQKFDWGRAIQAQKKPGQLHWVAFFGDVDHQIERVWSGARVTLTYLLRRARAVCRQVMPPAKTWPRAFKKHGVPRWWTRASFRTAEPSPTPAAISIIKHRVSSKSKARLRGNR